MRGSCIGVDYDYVIDVIAGSKACIARYSAVQAYNSCMGILYEWEREVKERGAGKERKWTGRKREGREAVQGSQGT